MDMRQALAGDPDAVAGLTLRVSVPKDNPVLTVTDCFANYDVTIKITRTESSDGKWLIYDFLIMGKVMDLSLVDMQIDEWRQKYQIPHPEDAHGQHATHQAGAAESTERQEQRPEPDGNQDR